MSAMNLIDFGVPAVQFLADIDWLRGIDQAPESTPTPIQRGGVSALRQLYHALSARIQNPSGRELLRDDVLVSNSEWVAASLGAMGIESSVIYPPVPWLSQEVDWNNRRKDFVWFGRITPQKKVEHAIQIVAGLRNAGLDCTIHIAGTAVDKGYLTFIQSLAKRMGDWVVLHSPLYGEEKAAFLTQFRYALHTRADEPFGITLVEFMKAGCIPFAPNSCGSAEILNHSAVLYDNEEEAVTKILTLISNPERSQSVRTFLGQRAEFFSTERFSESVVSLVSKHIEKAPSKPEVRISQT